MDDVLSGAHCFSEARKIQEEIINILKVGDFPLRKWSSNIVELINWLPFEILAIDPLTFSDNSASLAVLGISCAPQSDDSASASILNPSQ